MTRALIIVAAIFAMAGIVAIQQNWMGAPSREAESPGGPAHHSLSPGARAEPPSSPNRASRADTRAPSLSRTPDLDHAVSPDFERQAMDGTAVRLSSLRDHVVIVNFWATWCAPCRQEIPEFISLQRKMDGIQFVGVSLDEEGFDVVRPYAARMDIPYPLVIGDDSLAADFGGVLALPTTFILDRKGRIRQRFIGMVNGEILEPILTDLLSE